MKADSKTSTAAMPVAVTLSRRHGLMAGAASALAAGAVAVTTARAATLEAAGADAGLLALCDEALRLDARICEIGMAGTSEEECRATLDAWQTTYEAIIGIPATTWAGIQAKAKALHVATIREAVWAGFDDYLENPAAIDEHTLVDSQLARSLACDVLAWRVAT